MAGHSKWSNIQHKKGAQDAKRSYQFSKLIHEITVAARINGPDPASNPRLRAAIEKALAANMKRVTIEKAVQGSSKDETSSAYETVDYEGYAPGKIAFIVRCLTDNRRRTASEIRCVVNKAGAQLSSPNTVIFLFKPLQALVFISTLTEDQLLEQLIEHDIDMIDLYQHAEDRWCLRVTPESASQAQRYCKQLYQLESSQAIFVPRTLLPVSEEHAEQWSALASDIQNCQDVRGLYHNAQCSAV